MKKEDFRIIADVPKAGINFIDITPILNDKTLFQDCMSSLENKVVSKYGEDGIDVIVSMEARGFIFGAALAAKMGVRFVPARKVGKLPYETLKGTYSLEYGSDALEMHKDSINENDRVLILDDILATGGTAKCVCDMVKCLGGSVEGLLFVAELENLKAKEDILARGIPCDSLVSFTDAYLEENKIKKN